MWSSLLPGCPLGAACLAHKSMQHTADEQVPLAQAAVLSLYQTQMPCTQSRMLALPLHPKACHETLIPCHCCSWASLQPAATAAAT